MERRELLKQGALVMGYSISGGALSAILKSCITKPDLPWKPKILSAGQVRMVSEMTERVLPKSETPGAQDINVAQFVDLFIADVLNSEDQEKFIDGLGVFDKECQKSTGSSFDECNEEKQIAVLRIVEDRAFDESADDSDSQVYFYRNLKYLTLTGYFQSESIGKEILKYDPIPGQYVGCIPLEGNNWSL